jgi:SNF2 family DNA or RNA helicase
MDITNTCILACCNQSFCVECIIKSFSYSKKCPICRCQTGGQNIKIMSSKESKSNEKKNKLEMLVDIIQTKANSTFIVCCQFEKVFSNQIKELFHKHNISFSMLKGSGSHIQNIIDQFKNNQIRVLLLNPKYYGTGLNLEMCTDIITMHQMESDIYTQVIGRAQRPNRKTPLVIHRLCNTNEL